MYVLIHSLLRIFRSTCRESGDHGPINTWDRQPFFTDLKGLFIIIVIIFFFLKLFFLRVNNGKNNNKLMIIRILYIQLLHACLKRESHAELIIINYWISILKLLMFSFYLFYFIFFIYLFFAVFPYKLHLCLGIYRSEGVLESCWN